MKTLIVYYSYTNNTEKVAKKIAELKKYDILKLEPLVDYSTDYQKVVDEEEAKMDSEEIVELKPINVDLNQYDRIILGTPVWWYTMAPVVRSFLSGNNLNGKKVIAFITNGGWLGHTVNDIKKYCEVESYINLKFNGDKIQNEKSLSDWINSL